MKYKVELIKEIKEANPKIPVGTEFVVKEDLGSKIIAIPVEDVRNSPLFRRELVLYPDEYKLIMER